MAQPTRNHKPLFVTVFPNRFAKRKRVQMMTLDELRALVLSTNKRIKDRLPLIKLARFGDEPNDNKCLRYDANVRIVYGIEVDYDREVIPFDKFVAKLRRTGIKALVYTSPSCTPTRPRVRILLPFKKSLKRTQLKRRGIYVSMIDGLFGGNVFGAESWKLSQTYYIGRDLSNSDADFRAVVIEGDYIDERPDLERFETISNKVRQKTKQIWIEKFPIKTTTSIVQQRADRNVWQRFKDEGVLDDAAEALGWMDYKERHGGKGVHHTQRDVVYHAIGCGLPDDDVIELVLTTTMALPDAIHWNRKQEHKKIIKLCIGAHRRLAEEQAMILPHLSAGVVVPLDEYRKRQHQRLAGIFET
jgi:hypothetical protein